MLLIHVRSGYAACVTFQSGISIRMWICSRWIYMRKLLIHMQILGFNAFYIIIWICTCGWGMNGFI